MTVLSWAMLILAAMIGAVLFVTIGALMLALLFAQVSERLAHNDEHRNY